MKIIAMGVALVLITFNSIAQNVGIGTPTPSEKLEVNGNVKIQGSNVLEFGGNIAGKEVNAGKIGYNAFGTTALAIVGAGNTVATRSVYLFAEGGTNLNGPLSISGALRVGGNTGAAGQVLTSTGNGSPQWKTPAYGNNTRFSTGFGASGANTAMTYSTRYNLNPADIAINTNTITINKTGLYHFQGFFKFTANYSSAYTQVQAPVITASLFADDNYTMADNLELTPKTYYTSVFPFYSCQLPFSYDLHITAGTTIIFSRFFNGQTTNGTFSTSGHLSGYLISE